MEKKIFDNSLLFVTSAISYTKIIGVSQIKISKLVIWVKLGYNNQLQAENKIRKNTSIWRTKRGRVFLNLSAKSTASRICNLSEWEALTMAAQTSGRLSVGKELSNRCKNIKNKH